MLQASPGCSCLSLLSAEITDTCHLAQLGEIFMDPLLTLATEVQCIARLDPAGLLLRLHQLAIWHSNRDVRTRLPESLAG